MTSELRLRPAGPHLDAALVEPAIGPGTPTSVIRRRDRLVALLRRHRVMAVLVALGFALRVLTWLAYQPALLFTDSQYYLQNVGPLDPQYLDPIGYPLLVLKPLLPLGGLATVALVQHLAGLGMAVAIYLLALRHGARRWLAALAAAPVLLDAYQLQIEQNILTDVWLEVLAVALLWLLLGRGIPTARRAAVAGLVLGVAMTIRMVGVTLVVPAVLYLLLVGSQWRTMAGWRQIGARVGALIACFAVVVVSYAGYFESKAGYWGLSTSSGNALYGRTAVVADCSKLDLDPVLTQLCPAEPLGQRLGTDYYTHIDGDPTWPGYVPPGETKYDLDRQFAARVVQQQPWDVLRAVLVDFGKGFVPFRDTSPADPPVTNWQFQDSYPYFPFDPSVPDLAQQQTTATAVQFGGQVPTSIGWMAGILRTYQLDGGYVQGPLLALCGVVGLLGGLGIGRARRSGIRAAAMLSTATAVTVLGTAALFEFSWRYQLPGLALLPLAGVLGLTAFLGPTRRPTPARRRRKLLAPFPDPVDSRAVTDFFARYGHPEFAPIVVVIAAYNEEGGIGDVLDRLPSSCLDLPLDVLVVADGCRDATASVSIAHGAFTCVAPVNRGQGAALRLGYQLAVFGGARFVLTTDADGQYDNSEMPLLLGPLLADEADFVTGSRRLGVEDTDDRVRWAGVRVFAWLASLLAWRRLTDTSFGFRAMRASVVSGVRLRQPQYQASELLMGVLASGARVREVPMTMRTRSAGVTKKGNNLLYGCRYARVMLGTWVREYGWYRLTRRLRPAGTRSVPPELLSGMVFDEDRAPAR